ncbi:MAG: DUF4258 domain-containing protein [Candidatus Liptonbacteria bacterium]|nr:DUF4258 domain-containing protein [Candidatus Liptonbacteria bacterium]
MRIRYTKHALDRFYDRSIGKTDVKNAIMHGQMSNASGGMLARAYKKGGRTLIVKYVIKGVGDVEIITAYWQ